MFGVHPTKFELDTLLDYFGAGGTCVLGETFHKITMNYFLDKVTHIRATILGSVAQTPVGKEVIALAKQGTINFRSKRTYFVQKALFLVLLKKPKQRRF